jgi:aspartokinase/homoserine dehydrogenase 1
LIIRGPGAGPDVTAAGIFADLLRLSSMLSGHDD